LVTLRAPLQATVAGGLRLIEELFNSKPAVVSSDSPPHDLPDSAAQQRGSGRAADRDPVAWRRMVPWFGEGADQPPARVQVLQDEPRVQCDHVARDFRGAHDFRAFNPPTKRG